MCCACKGRAEWICSVEVICNRGRSDGVATLSHEAVETHRLGAASRFPAATGLPCMHRLVCRRVKSMIISILAYV